MNINLILYNLDSTLKETLFNLIALFYFTKIKLNVYK